jgi:hypothetical protein
MISTGVYLCNGGALYAPSSFLSIPNMLCGGGGERVVMLAVVYDPEPVFLKVYGAQEPIPRNEFRQPM